MNEKRRNGRSINAFFVCWSSDLSRLGRTLELTLRQLLSLVVEPHVTLNPVCACFYMPAVSFPPLAAAWWLPAGDEREWTRRGSERGISQSERSRSRGARAPTPYTPPPQSHNTSPDCTSSRPSAIPHRRRSASLSGYGVRVTHSFEDARVGDHWKATTWVSRHTGRARKL